MPKDDPYDWVRVKDSKTGHVFTTRRIQANGLQVLKQDAVDLGGDPLPPEYAEAPAEKKESQS